MAIEQYDLQPFPMMEQVSSEDTFVSNKQEISRFDEFKQREKTIRESTWLAKDNADNIVGVGEKWDAFSKTWDDTWAVKGYDYFKYDNGWLQEKDEAFMQTWSDEAVIDTLIASELPISYYQKLADAKNPEHKNALLTWAIQDKNRNEFIDKTLNSYGGVFTERTMSSLTTGLMDIDVPISAGFGLAAKATKARKIMTAGAVGTHMSAAAFIYETGDGEVSAGEAALFGMIGSLADGYAVSRLGRTANDIPTHSDLINRTTDALMDTPSNPKLTQLADSADNIRNQKIDREPIIETTRDRLEQRRVRDSEFDSARKVLDDEQTILNDRMDITPDEKNVIQKNIDKRRSLFEKDIDVEVSKRKTFDTTENGFKEFNKKVDDIQKNIQADKPWIASNLKNTVNDIKLLGDNIVESVAGWKQDLKQAIKSGDVNALNDFDNIITRLHDEGFITKDSFNKYNKSRAKNKFDIPEISVKMNKDGSYDLVTKRKGTSKTKVAVSGLLVTALAGEAMAEDGSGITSGNIFAIIAGAVALGMGVKNFKNISETVRDIKLLDRTRPMRIKVEQTLDSLRTSLTETTAPLMKDGNATFTDAVKRILWNPESNTGTIAERRKAMIFHSFSGNIHKQMNSSYLDYLKDNNVGRFKAAMTNLAFGEIGARLDFEIKVMEHVELGKHSDQPAIVRAGDEVKKSLKAFKAEMVASGMKGADKMFDLGESFMPRYFRGSSIRVVLRSLDARQYDSFVQQFAKMMDGDISKAREYLEMMTESKDVKKRMTSMKDIEAFIEKKNLTSLTADEVAEELGIGTSRSGRTKARIDIEKARFEPITIKTLDGNTVTLNLNDIFVNNSIETLDRYFNSQSGHIALADVNFKSVDDARSAANEAVDGKNSKVLNDVIDNLIGEPIMDLHSDAAKSLQLASDFAVALKMPMSVISLTQETFNSIVKARGGMFKTAMEEVTNIFNKQGTSSAIVEELMDITGQGAHKYSASYGAFSHMGEGIDNMVTGGHGTTIKGVAGKFSEILRDTTLYNLGLVPVSDFLTRINLVDSASYLHDIAHGTKTMPDYLKKAVSLTPEIEAMLRTKLVKDNNGVLQAMGVRNWDRADRLALADVVDNMMMKRIQQTTQGGTPAWGRDNMLGVVATQLLKFPIQAFSNHGIFDLKGSLIHKDPRAMGAMMAWFSGGYVAAALRAKIQGREVTEDDLLLAAVRSMPLVGGVEGIYRSLTDAPAMFSAMGSFNQGMQDIIGVVASDN